MYRLTLSLILISLQLSADPFTLAPTESKIRMLYNSLSPRSISQHLAFYELYSSHTLGKKSLEEAWRLLNGQNLTQNQPSEMQMPSLQLSIIGLINKTSDQRPLSLDDSTLQLICPLSANLAHYSLLGHHVWSEEEVLQLPLDQIDLARAILISQIGDNRRQILSYEAQLDLMALQIKTRLPPNATAEQKIDAINTFIFEEMEFRYPPLSIFSKDVDIYTCLHTVLDSHRGICLGVSVLYITLAQRLNLTLEAVTPPGHIFVRYRNGDKIINIETTARGIHIDSEEYLNVETKSLQLRTIREVIGLSYVNQSSHFLQNKQYQKALENYQKASLYLPNDPLVKELMGYTYLFLGQEQQGRRLLTEICHIIPSHSISRDTMAEDFLKGYIHVEGMQAIFERTEEDRAAVMAKKETLEKLMHECPNFRAGLLNLAMVWMELHREKEALKCLEKYHSLNPNDPSVEYNLAMLYLERMDYNKAWKHLHNVETIVQLHDYHPEELSSLRRELSLKCPE